MTPGATKLLCPHHEGAGSPQPIRVGRPPVRASVVFQDERQPSVPTWSRRLARVRVARRSSRLPPAALPVDVVCRLLGRADTGPRWRNHCGYRGMQLSLRVTQRIADIAGRVGRGARRARRASGILATRRRGASRGNFTRCWLLDTIPTSKLVTSVHFSTSFDRFQI
jgi:hypothetical protein